MSFQQLHHLPLFAAALASPHAPLLPWEAWEGRPLGWEPKWIFVGGFARSGTTLVAAALANWSRDGRVAAHNLSSGTPLLGSLSAFVGRHEQDVFPDDTAELCEGWLHGALCPPAFDSLSTSSTAGARLQQTWRDHVVPQDADVVAEADPDFYSLLFKTALFPQRSTALLVMRHPFATYSGAEPATLCEDAPACLGQWSATWVYTLGRLNGCPFAVVRSESLSSAARVDELLALATGLVRTRRPKLASSPRLITSHLTPHIYICI